MSVDWTDEAEAAAALRGSGIESDLTDAQLHQKALDAVAAIAARGGGPSTDVDQVYYGTGQSLLELIPPASAVATVVEAGTSLTDGTDYRLRPGGRYLERLYAGYPSGWSGRVTFTSSATVDARYDRVVCDLVRLALAYSGYDSVRDGDYAEEALGARGGGTKSYQDEREILISELVGATFA